MKRYISSLLLATLLMVFSCENEPENVPILKGTINGQIRMQDCYGYNLDDLSGVQVFISSGIFSADTITDSEGKFTFENVPFGKYNLICKKENFLQEMTKYSFGHVGGDVATTVNENLVGIPDFGIICDSVELDYCLLYTWVTLSEATDTPYYHSCWVLMYFNDSPDVDSVNYMARAFDVLRLPMENGIKVYFRLCESDVLDSFTGDSIYCRIYPAPLCYTSTNEGLFSLPTGKPSNVFAFKRISP